uniref:PH domain-containing protein n=1 Tax=Globisporangium ultimum (strain ATCC 200006 / CBS 805.95 / DAOM BR144) TaxID=431595 RepID=K3X155_GLOUD
MEGFLDLLPAATLGLSLKKRAWTRSFFRLHPAFPHVLEFFGDASMQQRKGKIDLRNAQIATTDELGGLLFRGDGSHRKAELSSKISMENSRRFVLRVSEDGDAAAPPGVTRPQQPRRYKHHYVCAEIMDDSGQVNAQMSRQYSQQWLQALQAAAISATPKAPPSDSRELSNQIAAFMDRMHLAACVSCRHVESKKSVFEVTVKAWILQRELVPSEDDNDDSESWQVLEYACAWKVRKTTAQFREFDAQMRQFYRDELRDLSGVPSSSGNGVGLVMHLLQSAEEEAAAHQRRVTALDAYFQQLLRLPAFTAFGSDASVMLDNFLDISAHLASFRQLEKATGHNMQLRKRKVVSWAERVNFERLYQMHLDAAAQRPAPVPHARKSGTMRGSEKHHHHHHHHGDHQHRHRESSKPRVEEERVPALPASVDAVRQPSLVEHLPSVTQETHTETVQERIAKIGKKLIVEAFTAPPVLVDFAHAPRSSSHR